MKENTPLQELAIWIKSEQYKFLEECCIDRQEKGDASINEAILSELKMVSIKVRLLLEKERQAIMHARVTAPLLNTSDMEEYTKEAYDYFTNKYNTND